MRRLRTLEGADLRRDGIAGLVLGVESVPDGLAGGLLAGVNPVYGLHAYLVGTAAGALSTSSTFMAVQATGAMAIVVADVDAVHRGVDPDRALFTLAVLTGLVMVVAWVARLGLAIRFVSSAVMVGFVSAVGVNIVLGQLEYLTGCAGDGSNRVARAVDTVAHAGSWHSASVFSGVATIVLIVVLERTRLGALGMVVAVALTSAAGVLLDLDVVTVADVASVPRALPTPVLPDLTLVPTLAVPAVALAFVGLVQGAGISASMPNPDGNLPDASRDFVGQGVANVAAGVLQGMPVGGSMSATALVTSAGARSRLANIVASGIMAVIVLTLAPAVEAVTMAALAGLLMVVGARSVRLGGLVAAWKTGWAQRTAAAATFLATLVLPIQYAVLLGVAISFLLFVVGRSNRFRLMRRELRAEGMREVEPPSVLPAHEVVVLQPYGSLFFGSAAVFEDAVPAIGAASTGTVVILRLRGITDVGVTFGAAIRRYAEALHAAGSKLVLVGADERVLAQLTATGVVAAVGVDNVYGADEWVGATLRRAHDEALGWVERRRDPGTTGDG